MEPGACPKSPIANSQLLIARANRQSRIANPLDQISNLKFEISNLKSLEGAGLCQKIRDLDADPRQARARQGAIQSDDGMLLVSPIFRKPKDFDLPL